MYFVKYNRQKSKVILQYLLSYIFLSTIHQRIRISNFWLSLPVAVSMDFSRLVGWPGSAAILNFSHIQGHLLDLIFLNLIFAHVFT